MGELLSYNGLVEVKLFRWLKNNFKVLFLFLFLVIWMVSSRRNFKDIVVVFLNFIILII